MEIVVSDNSDVETVSLHDDHHYKSDSDEGEWNWKIDPKEAFLPKVKTQAELSSPKNRRTSKFYKNQNELIQGFIEIHEEGHVKKNKNDDEEPFVIKTLIWVSLFTNVLLFFIKVIAYIDSGSLSVLASVLDSALDLLSGSVLFVTSWIRQKRDPYLYPAGQFNVTFLVE
jgi:hypothetical protein